MDLLEDTNHSFIIKVWLEEEAGERSRARWRGQIDHIPGGERLYFDALAELPEIIGNFLEEWQDSGAAATRGDMVGPIFPFLRDRGEPEDDDATEVESEARIVATTHEPVNEGSCEMAPMADSPQHAILNMRKCLQELLPSGNPPLPDPDISITNVSELPLAIGNFRGMDRRGSFTVAALKGGRLQAAVRFQLWGENAGDVSSALDDLHGALLASRDRLWRKGLLRILPNESSPAEHVTSVDGWRKSADYNVLYEYHIVDSDGAESLIARIPIGLNTDTAAEQLVVSDEMTRWDDIDAPALTIAGRATIHMLSALSSLSDPLPGNQFILTRTHTGAGGPPTTFNTLPEYLTAITDPVAPTRHAQLVFTGLAAFLEEFTTVDAPIVLSRGNDGTPAEFQAAQLTLQPAIPLPHPTDRLQLVCENGVLDQSAVVYIQAKPLL